MDRIRACLAGGCHPKGSPRVTPVVACCEAVIVLDAALSANRGIALPVLRATAFFRARRFLNEFEILPDFCVIRLVGDHVDEGPAGAPLGFVHQRFQFLFAGLSSRSLRGELLAVEIIILGGIGEDRELTFERRRARRQCCGEDEY
jgi:hypothetical protein